MRVRMVTTAAGPEFVYQAGETWDLETALAQRLIAAGAAVALDQVAPVAPVEPEAAVVGPEETAMLKPARRGRK